MVTPPLADPHRCPNLGTDTAHLPADDLLRATWLAAVEAQRLARLETPDPEAERLCAIVLANERLLRGEGPLTAG